MKCFKDNLFIIYPVQILVLQFVMTDFRSQRRQRFFDIQLTAYKSLETSLDDYITEQFLDEDNMYHTEQYGSQPAKKGVKISVLPPVLMIQLKRFQFSYETQRNQKVLNEFSYPQQVDFSRWTINQNKQVYQLYAVLVHQGLKADSGHYYVFLNIQSQWYKFNDQSVEYVNKQKVFNYNFGGSYQVLQFDQRDFKIKPIIQMNKSTAYMLVYVNKQIKSSLLGGQIVEPAWILQKNIQKIKQQQQKKQRKNFFFDLTLIQWEQHLHKKSCKYLGLFQNEDPELLNTKSIQKINKNQKVTTWFKQNRTNQSQGLYLYYQHIEKQILVSASSRSSELSFQQLLKQVQNPLFILFPEQTNKNDYLIITKLFLQNLEQNCFTFDHCFSFKRQATLTQVYQNLNKQYQQTGYRIKYFIQDAKVGLTEIRPSNQFLPQKIPLKNILLIVLVQKVLIQIKEQNQIQNWFNKQWNKVQLVLKSQDGQFQFNKEVDRTMNIDDLRKLIYQQIGEDHKRYASQNHIIIKSRQKKNSKIFSESNKQQSVKQLIKFDYTLMFGPSMLKIDERVKQLQCSFYYRYSDFMMSPQIVIIINKKSDPLEIINSIRNNQQVQKCLQAENLTKSKIFFLNKDKHMINDVVNEKGLVQGKGQLINVIIKEKNSTLIVEGVGLQQDDSKQEEICYLCFHHITQTYEKIGRPRCIQINKTTRLIDVRRRILDIILNENYNFQDKIIPINPFKVKITAYIKQAARGVILSEEDEDIEFKDDNKNNQSKVQNGLDNKDLDEKNVKEQSVQQVKQNGESIHKQQKLKTIQSEFGKNNIIKIQICHTYISKSIQALRLFV